MPNVARTLALAALAATAAAPALAADFVALTADNRLVAFNSDARRAAAPVAIRGVDGSVVGIDVRPANGMLYALSSTSKLYTVDARTGSATMVSQLDKAWDGGGRSVVDFNPAADRLRVMGMNGNSFRINVETGAAAIDGTLKYEAGTPLAGSMPRVTAGAYRNSVAGTTMTALYTIDTLAGSYNLQAPPNDGVQKPIARLDASLPPATAFDIETSGEMNTGWVLAGGTLHTIDVASGAITRLGPVANLPANVEITDIAVLPRR
jgi:hypothetical protein